MALRAQEARILDKCQKIIKYEIECRWKHAKAMLKAGEVDKA